MNNAAIDQYRATGLKRNKPGRAPRAEQVRRWLDLNKISQLSARTIKTVLNDESVPAVDRGKVAATVWTSILKSITHKQGLDATQLKVEIINNVPAPGDQVKQVAGEVIEISKPAHLGPVLKTPSKARGKALPHPDEA